MFRHHGPGRSPQENRVVASYLALVGGFVDSAGFVVIGTFTSHVTGNVGRLSNDLAGAQFGAAATALTMLVAFFFGALVASMVIESSFFGRNPAGYGVALLTEAVLLLLFMGAATLTPAAHPRLMDLEAAILCASMGMQNSLVTRLSGAVVRTTHLTGVLTDLGIEAGRWFRWWRVSLSERVRVKLAFGENPPGAPVGAQGRAARHHHRVLRSGRHRRRGPRRPAATRRDGAPRGGRRRARRLRPAPGPRGGIMGRNPRRRRGI